MSKQRFFKNDRGMTLVEYALTAPMFFLLLMGMFEVASLFFVQTTLEAAIFQASRFGRTGDLEPGKTQEETVRDLLNQYTYGMLTPSRLHLRILPVADFASAQITEVGVDAVSFGGPNQPVIYTVTYDWPMFTQLVFDALGVGDTFRLTASAVVMNEPY